MKNPPKHLKSLLWEYDIQKMSIDHPTVSERVLLLGDKDDIQYVGLDRLKRYFVEKYPHLDIKSHNFWKMIFSIDITTTPRSIHEQINHPTSRRDFG